MTKKIEYKLEISTQEIAHYFLESDVSEIVNLIYYLSVPDIDKLKDKLSGAKIGCVSKSMIELTDVLYNWTKNNMKEWRDKHDK